MVNDLQNEMSMEQAVLGCMIVSNAARRHALDNLTSADFTTQLHKHVFGAIETLDTTNQGIDELTIIEHLEQTEGLAKDHKLEIISLVERVPAVSNHRSYAKSVKEASALRAVLELAHDMQTTTHGLGDPLTRLDEIDKLLVHTRSRITGKTIQAGTSFAKAWEDLNYNQGPDTDTIPFPIGGLNEIGGGQRKGQLVITGGYSADGKSWFGLDCVETAAKHGAKCLVQSIEMPTDEVAARFVAMDGHDYQSILTRRISEEQLADRLTEMCGLKIMVFDASTGMVSATDLTRELRRAKLDNEPYRYVLIDHLHLLDVGGSRDGYRLALGRALTELKRAAVEYGCTIHVLAQLRRSADPASKSFPVPKMTDFRESSAIENIADYGLMVYRIRNEAGSITNQAQIVPVKARSGVIRGPVDVMFDPRSFRFREPLPPGVVRRDWIA